MTMKSIFDIIGPVMIGPSSSHTAGAVRIARAAKAVLGEKIIRAEITLYGSFAKTGRGHGTDRALAGGLLGMDTDDPRIKDALTIASHDGLKILFNYNYSENIHPNTVDFNITSTSGRTVYVEGCSTGGGNIIISRINQFEVNIDGRYPALLVEHADKPGVLGRAATLLGQNAINIAQIRMAREQKGINKLAVIETDEPCPEEIRQRIIDMPHIIEAVNISLV